MPTWQTPLNKNPVQAQVSFPWSAVLVNVGIIAGMKLSAVHMTPPEVDNQKLVPGLSQTPHYVSFSFADFNL